MTGETPSTIPELHRRMLLRGGLAAGAGLAIAGLGTVGLTRVAEAVTFDTQFYWAYCNNCASLWYTHNNTAGVCASGGGGHIKSPSFSYELRYNVSGTGGPSYQPGWNWCGKCQCLFFANNATYSACPAAAIFGYPHKTGGLAYSVLYNDAVAGSSQPNWWWCGQCQGLFNSSGGAGGHCPGTQDGDGPHLSGQGSLFDPPIINSLAYDVSYYSTSSP